MFYIQLHTWAWYHLNIYQYANLYTTEILYIQVRFVGIKHRIQFAVHLNDCHLTLFQSKLIQQIAAPQLERLTMTFRNKTPGAESC